MQVCIDNTPVSCFQLAKFVHLDGQRLQQQYKDHISDFQDCDQKDHAPEWMLFEENLDSRLSIDETAVSNGE